MKKLKAPAGGFLAGSILFGMFLTLFVTNYVLLPRLLAHTLQSDPAYGFFNNSLFTVGVSPITAFDLVGYISLGFIAVSLFMMLIASSVLVSKTRYAVNEGNTLEQRWSISILVLNIIFILCFLGFFIVSVLIRQGIMNDTILFSWVRQQQDGTSVIDSFSSTSSNTWPIDIFTNGLINVSSIMTLVLIVGCVFSTIASTLSVVIINRAKNKSKSDKEYVDINIF